MFESHDDIDVDDEFLSGIFDSDPVEFENASSSPRNNIQNGLISRNEPVPWLGSEKNETFEIQHHLSKPKCSKIVTPVKSDAPLVSTTLNLSKDPSESVLHSNKENKRKHIYSPIPLRTKRERKFPGPAGLLPDRKSSRGTPIKIDSILETDKSPPNSSPDELCSQGRCSGSVLEEEPWQNLLADLGPDRNILDVVNVVNIKRKAAAKCFVGKKVPFLAAVLHHLDVSSPDPCVILRDSTGEIHGTLHREVWEQFAGDLIVGSVLVVRNVGLLSTGLSSRRHYLNITANNLVTIYSANSDKSGKPRLHSFSRPDFKEIVTNWGALVSPSHGIGSPVSLGSPTLFNSSFTSPINNSSVQNLRNVNVSGNLPRRTLSNQNSTGMPQNSRSNVPLNVHCTTPRMSSSPISVNSRVVDKSLPSFLKQTFHQSSSENKTSITPTAKKVDSRYFNNSNSSTPTSAVSSKLQKLNNNSNTSNVSKEVPFHFSPVVVKPKCSDNKILSCFNSENKSVHNPPSNINRVNFQASTSSMVDATKVALTQTSELTQEEQSMVESVFDGIDADSLFDDDF